MKLKQTLLLSVLSIIFLSGCLEERYRYFCQSPDNFHAEQCQKPKCLFTQTCPEYLVAPILEKKVGDIQPIPQESQK